MLRSYTDLLDYAIQWRLIEADQVLQEAAKRLGRETPELWHHWACVKFAQQDFAAARDLFHRALEATPNDSQLLANWQMLRDAGPMDYQQHGAMAMRLLETLRALEFLYVPDGARQVMLPLFGFQLLTGGQHGRQVVGGGGQRVEPFDIMGKRLRAATADGFLGWRPRGFRPGASSGRPGRRARPWRPI